MTVVGDFEPSDAALEAIASMVIEHWLEHGEPCEGFVSDGATPQPESGSADAHKKGMVLRVR